MNSQYTISANELSVLVELLEAAARNQTLSASQILRLNGDPFDMVHDLKHAPVRYALVYLDAD